MSKKMLPSDDWKMLDELNEEQLKILLRIAVSNFRMILDGSPKNLLQDDAFTATGHAKASGLASAFILQWENLAIEKEVL